MVVRTRSSGYLSYNEGMAVKLTPAGVFGKWVIAPIALALFGYFVVGPKIGNSDPGKAKDDASSTSGPANAYPDASPSPGTKKNGAEPEVDVTVAHASESNPNATSQPDPIQQDQTVPVVKKKHHKAPPKDPDDENASPKPPRPGTPDKDEGGSAGSTTAGGPT